MLPDAAKQRYSVPVAGHGWLAPGGEANAYAEGTETPPDLKRLMHENMEAVFTAASQPSRVRVSTPRREPSGMNWTACVRADLNSVMGKPLGTQTYRLSISGNVIVDRRRVEDDDNCSSETYEPI